MIHAKLTRQEDDGVQTLGLLTVFDDDVIIYTCSTLELAWKDNKKSVSCIPSGTYKVVKRNSHKYGDHFHILGVPERSFILIHPANYHTQLEGCIAVGRFHKHIDDDGRLDVTNSKDTMNHLLKIIDEDEFKLKIKYKNMNKIKLIKGIIKGLKFVLPIINKNSSLKTWQKIVVTIAAIAAFIGLSALGIDSAVLTEIIEGIIAAFAG